MQRPPVPPPVPQPPARVPTNADATPVEDSQKVALVLLRAGGSNRQFDLTLQETVIGRREDCGLRIPLGDVSRRHCIVRRDDKSLTLQDLGSSNGTFVNNRRVQESPLLPGDRVTIGNLTFVVQVDGEPFDLLVPPAERAAAALTEVTGLPPMDPGSLLNPTAQSDAADGSHHGLDPSGAAAIVDDLMQE